MYMEISETNIIFYPDRNTRITYVIIYIIFYPDRNITYVITDGKCYNGSKK